MTAPRLRLAVVGAGRIARDYLGVLAEHADYEVVGVVDPDEAARAGVAQAGAAPTHASIKELLAAGAPPDAGLVLAPPAVHEELALELIGAGVHVLCEKPIALGSASAQRMFQTATRARRALMMCAKFRYVDDVREARELIAQGAIGDVIAFENAFCSPVDMTDRWNADATVSGGGVLIDNGCHAVDLARYFLGPLIRVWAHFGRRSQPIRVEDSVHLVFETGRAVIGSVDLSWSCEAGNDHFVTLRGSEGVVQIGWQGSRIKRHGDADWRAFGKGYDKRRAFGAQLRNFAGVVRGDEDPQVSAQDAVEAARAIEAAYRSARVGRWVPLHGYDGQF